MMDVEAHASAGLRPRWKSEGSDGGGHQVKAGDEEKHSTNRKSLGRRKRLNEPTPSPVGTAWQAAARRKGVWGVLVQPHSRGRFLGLKDEPQSLCAGRAETNTSASDLQYGPPTTTLSPRIQRVSPGQRADSRFSIRHASRSKRHTESRAASGLSEHPHPGLIAGKAAAPRYGARGMAGASKEG
jgi:hypothetical protein